MLGITEVTPSARVGGSMVSPSPMSELLPMAKTLKDQPVGGLATFDLMFGGIRTALKSSVQQSIHVAERDIADIDPFAVRVLKALFLVKYVKEFKATPRNLTVLMLPHFNADIIALRTQVETALSLLEQQTYVQRNGDIYEYLTDEEKDVEEEIKSVEISTDKLLDHLSQLIFDQTLRGPTSGRVTTITACSSTARIR